MTDKTSECLECWNDGPTKSAIVDFVERVTRDGSADYVAPDERIAVFDNDGTLWCEYPMQVQVFFALAQVERLARLDPALLEKPAFKAMVEGDLQDAGVAAEEGSLRAGLRHARRHDRGRVPRHRRGNGWTRRGIRRCTQLFEQGAYLPQCELLTYLRVNGFKTYIVTGGGVEFVRVVAEELYGIPPEQVIGSSTRMKVETVDGQPVLRKLPELGSFDDREEKVVNIACTSGAGRSSLSATPTATWRCCVTRWPAPVPRMACYLHHDDAEREFAYDRDFKLSALSDGLDHAAEYGIGTVVSMKNDWKRGVRDR